MIIAKTITQCTQAVRAAREEGKTIGLVPTMGALHAGHLALIEACRGECGWAAVSIFVNPTQFGPGEDFGKYPRPIAKDLEICRGAGVDLVFCPEAGEMYPGENVSWVHVEKLGDYLCGAARPGHFRGVCTVVAKLFHIVGPDVAFFGQKDAQQLAIIARMVRDLNFGVQIRACPTVREADGLALSSRNAYLSPEQRRQAGCLWQALQAAQGLYQAGQNESGVLMEAMRKVIAEAPEARIDYISIVDRELLQPLAVVDRPALVALAVFMGRTRLIDNIMVVPGAKLP